MQCQSCLVVKEETEATTTRNGEHVCEACADEIDAREAEQDELRRTAYDERGIRR